MPDSAPAVNTVGTSAARAADAPVDGTVPARRVSMAFPADFAAARAARAVVLETCAAWGIDSVSDDAELVVTELVENAVRHARSGGEVTLEHLAAGLLVSVRDASTHPPMLAHPGDTISGGRGLLLIERLCRSWGFDRSAAGKVVWALLPIDDSHGDESITTRRKGGTAP